MGDSPIYNPRYETMPRPELEQLQLERLQATVNRAYKNVPLYRGVLDNLGLQPEDFQSRDDLRKLPFTTKDDLRRAYPYGLLAVPLREVVRFHMSSGTTGSPTVVAYTANDLQHWTDLVARNLVAAGITREDVVQVFFGYGLFSGGFGLHQGAEAIGASVLPVSSAELIQQVKMMQDFRTTALVGMPSYALDIAAAVEEEGIDPHSLSLRLGCFGAEPWSERTREEIERRLGLLAYDNYGLSEMGGPGVSGECVQRHGMHLAEDHYLVEVIDPATGELVPDGDEGELVFTTLTKEATPLLRYRSGDLSSIDTAPCECGRTSARMARVWHRSDDMLILHGINVFPADVGEALAEFPEAGERFQLVVERVGGRDQLEVRIELSGFVPDTNQELLRVYEKLTRRLEQVLSFEPKMSLLGPRGLLENGLPAPRVVDKREA
jgi:phenylacetate-CoA ligase